MPRDKNIKFILNYFLGPLVFLLLSYAVYHQILHQPDWRQSLHQIRQAITGPQGWKMAIVLLLMLVNWGLEAKKWQLSLFNLQPISFANAFKATLAGTTMASFTPNRMGEYMGRILYVEEGKRMQAIPLTIVCSIAQMIITLLAGLVGILCLKWRLYAQPSLDRHLLLIGLNILIVMVIGVLVVLILFYFRLSWSVRFFERMRISDKYIRYVKMLKDFNTSLLAGILFLSFGRYLVFIIQYFLLFSVFGVVLSWGETFTGVSVMFLVMAIVPSFTFLTELGLRWEASIQVIELFSANRLGIFAASLGVWIVNLIIPALIGSLLILSIKLYRK